MLYRFRQVWWRLKAIFTPLDDLDADDILSPELLILFRRMSSGDRHHALRVMQALKVEGHTHPDLLVAALLHDVGKARYTYTVVGRIWAVMLQKLLPRLAERIGQKAPHGLWRPVVIVAQHPAWSAEDMAAAGASELAVALARHHQDERFEGSEELHRLHALLKIADSKS